MKQKNILIAGGAGFIGSHLCKSLLAKNQKVICIDNLSSGQYQNIEPLTVNKNFNFIDLDITHDINHNIFPDVNEIYNLACPASPLHYQQTPIETTMSSVLGSYNLLNLAKTLDAKYLFSSTSEIYGDPEVHPQPESYNGNTNCLSLRACYVEGKRSAEALCYDFKRQFNLDTKVVRIFNTYGPNMKTNDGRVVSNFIFNILNNQNIEIYGDGEQTRSFCYIDDLVNGLELTMNSKQSGPINLGNPDEISIKNLGLKLLKLMDSRAQIEHTKAISDEPKIRQPDITLAQKSLGWSPETPLNKGLQKTIDYFNKIH